MRALAAAIAEVLTCRVPPACAIFEADRSLLRPPDAVPTAGRFLCPLFVAFRRVFLTAVRFRTLRFRTALYEPAESNNRFLRRDLYT